MPSMKMNLLCAVVIIFLFSNVHSRTLCTRIFFHNIDEDKMPYKYIEGVFVKESYSHNGFPVYKRENDNLLFYLRKEGGKEYLLFSTSLDKYFGIGAHTTLTTALTWLATGTLDRNDVFGGLISYWMYFNSRDIVNYKVSEPPYIKAICVDDDFRECSSDKVYFNTNFTDGKNNILNNMNTDYFERQPDDFRNLRPVYKHNKLSWYLQYTKDKYWLVTTTRYPNDYNDAGALLRVNDLALRPEYINTTWSLHFKGWSTKPGLVLRCRGVQSQANVCSTTPCSNGGTCVFTSGNETVCVCPAGYYGDRCTKTKKCPSISSLSTELGFGNPGFVPGYLAMSFCRTSYPSVVYAFCSDGSYYSSPYWSRQGSSCNSPTAAPTPYYLTTPWSSWSEPWTSWSHWNPYVTPASRKRFNSNDVEGLNAGILSIAIILQVLLAFILWTCACCKKMCKEVDEEEDDQRRQDEFGQQLEARLENVRRAESQEELDHGVQEYRRTVEEYQRETEATQLKRKKGFYRNASFVRLFSMHFFFSFYMWLIYMLGCRATKCAQYGDVFGQLAVMGLVMLILCPIFVFIESIFSHELSYIKNIMHDETAWSYIQRMHAVAPVISMTVECYHWETRVRTVYYTDANGNTQSRTETYQERVVTYVDEDEFAYGCWVDVSKKEMPALSYVALTRVKIDPFILFGDQETEQDFDRQREEMLDRNRHRDELMDFSFNKSIPGLQKRISAYVNLTLKPWWISQGFYWLATLLMLTWPYRWFFRAKTAKTYYEMKKKMYKCTTPPPEVDIMDPIAILQQTSNQPGSNINPSFALTELPSSTGQPYPGQPPYPGQLYPGQPPYSGQPPYPGQPITNEYTPLPANQQPGYPTAPPAYTVTNQAPANQGPGYPPTNQNLPSIPPPAYDQVTGPASQSATSPHGSNAHV